MIKSIGIKDLSFLDLQEIVSNRGENKFRAAQIFDWLYKKKAENPDRIKNVPKEFLTELLKEFPFSYPTASNTEKSSDGTLKFAIKLKDNEIVESVIIPRGKRNTLCISTQVGCRFNCKICLTAEMGFTRNLSSGEILDQLIAAFIILAKSNASVTNIVFMGMGEPLDNLTEVSKAIEIICSKEAFAMSPRRITVSTVGIPDKLKELSIKFPRIGLAFSIHAPTDSKRKEIVPLAKKFTIKEIANELMAAGKRGNEITFEYVLIKDFNSSLNDAKSLLQLLSFYSGKLNLIPVNPGGRGGYMPPTEEEINSFMSVFLESKITVTVRRSAGSDINGACGQLYTKIKKGKSR